MIKNFKSKTAQDVYDGASSRHARRLSKELHVKAQRLFDQINAATNIDTLKIPPSNRLEKLVGDRKDQYSLRINKQWRIVFYWDAGFAIDVDIIDYH